MSSAPWYARVLPSGPPKPPPGCFVQVAGRAVHVVLDGPSEAPPVLLEPGLGGAWLGWDPVVPLLAADCRVIRADRPGLGCSQPEPGVPTLGSRADWVVALLDALDVKRPVVLCGHSLGGLYAEGFARLHPGRTAGLVLVEASAENVSGAPLRAPRTRVRAARGVGTLFRWAGLSQVVAPELRRLGVRTQSLRGSDQADRGDAYRSAYGSGHCLTEALVERVLVRDLLAELDVLRERRRLSPLPVRVLSSPGDEPRGLRALTDQSPLAEHRVVTGTRHLMPVDRPDVIAAAVREVSARADAGRPPQEGWP